MLQLPQVYQLDIEELEHAYQRAIAACHPDKHHNDPMLKAQAERMSAGINLAYDTLVDPLARAEHLLAVIDNNSTYALQTSMDANFLMQQMNWREKIAEANQHEKLDLREQVSEKYAVELDNLARCFDQNWQVDEGLMQQILQLIGRANYWRKLQKQLM